MKREAKSALQESERLYRLMFESNPLPMWVYDARTLSFLAVNEASVRRYGYSREEFLAMTLRDIRPGEDVPLLEKSVSILSKAFEDSGVWRHRKKDGTIMFVEIVSHELEFEERPARLVLANDVTARKRDEETLLHFAAIVESSNDAIISKNLDGTITSWNPAAERLFGYAAGEVKGRSIEFLFPPDRLDEERQILAKLKRGERIEHFETVRVRKDGRAVDVSVTISPVKDGSGQIIGISKMARDITDRRRAEEEIRRLNRELEQRVHERTAQLEVANRELEAFSYSVSHDLRAPLRAIDGFSRALLEDCANKLDDRSKSHLERVCSASRHMNQLIDDLLDLSRVSRGELRRMTVDLSAMARGIAAELQQTQPHRSAEFVIETGLVAHFDASLIRIVLTNLLGNAWKFTGKLAQSRIEFGSAPGKDQRACFVRDNGAGFDMAYSGKLFGAFQRLHSVTEFEGTGVGLATVQRIVHRHGGHVWAEGAVGKGSVFYFTLPG